MTFEDEIRDAFYQVREEIDQLKVEILALRKELRDLSDIKTNLTKEIEDIKTNFKHEISIGNRGVPANQQTNTSTFSTPSFPVDGILHVKEGGPAHDPAHFPAHPQHIRQELPHSSTSDIFSPALRHIPQTASKTPPRSPEMALDEGINDLSDLIEALKTDLKKKFKALTKQEFHIFSVLYTVDKTQNIVTYQDLAARTGLTASSIRDYIQRIVKKGIPIIKEKQNNKVVMLKLPAELKNLATLDSLMRLRQDFQDENLDSFSKR